MNPPLIISFVCLGLAIIFSIIAIVLATKLITNTISGSLTPGNVAKKAKVTPAQLETIAIVNIFTGVFWLSWLITLIWGIIRSNQDHRVGNLK